jgi:formamidopyrimidine-DNA glycosylase
MSGQMLLQQPGTPDEKHLRVRFILAGGLEMRFVDQRMFGGLLISDGGAELPREIVHIGRDPLDPEFDQDAVVGRIRRRTVGIKRQLLDQGLSRASATSMPTRRSGRPSCTSSGRGTA